MKSMTKATRFNKVMSFVLTVLMVISMMSVFTVSTLAEDSVGELKLQIIDSTTKTALTGGVLVKFCGAADFKGLVKVDETTDNEVAPDEKGMLRVNADDEGRVRLKYTGNSNPVRITVDEIYLDGVERITQLNGENNKVFINSTVKPTVTFDQAEKTLEVTIPDIIAPDVALSPVSAEWAKTVTLTATTTADDVVEYKWSCDDQPIDNNASILIAEKNGTYTVIAVDKAGNESASASVTLTKIDRTAPVISPVAEVPDGKYHQSVTVTVDADDGEGSGIAFYKMDENAWIPASQTDANVFTVSDEQTHKFYVKDAVGNEQYVEFKSNNVDITAPTISVVAPSDDDWHKDSVDYVITATDDKELALTYGVGDTFETAVWETADDNKITVTERTAHTFWVKDSANNYASYTLSDSELPRIDGDAPVLGEVTTSIALDVYTKDPVDFTVNATDALSGIAYYNIDNAVEWIAATEQDANVFTISDNREHTVSIKDKAGNIITTKIQAPKYDAKKPVINSVSVDPDQMTNTAIKFTVDAMDEADDYNAASGVAYVAKINKNAAAPQGR